MCSLNTLIVSEPLNGYLWTPILSCVSIKLTVLQVKYLIISGLQILRGNATVELSATTTTLETRKSKKQQF